MTTTAKNSVPELRFPSFQGDWISSKFGEISTVIRGSSPRPKGDPRYYGPGVPRLMVEDVARDGKFVNPTTDSLTPEGAKLSRPCKKGTLTIVCSGTAKTVGQASFLETDACIHDGFLAMVEIDDDFDPDFIFYQIQKFQAQAERMATHGGTFINLTTGILKDFSRSFPPLPEQRKIADFLTAVDGRIGQLIQKKALLEDYKKGVMQQLFTQAIRFKDDHGNDFPNWEEKKLGEIGDFKSGVGFSENEQGGKVGTPFYKVSDMNLAGNESSMNSANHYVSKAQISANKYKVIADASLVFAKVGAAIFLERKRVASNFLIDNNMMAFIPSFAISFAKHLFATIRLSKFAQVGALPSYNASDLRTIKVSIPQSPDEQTKIADFLSAIDHKIESIATQITETQTFKRGLLQKMFV